MSFTNPNSAKTFDKVRQGKQISKAEADHLQSKNIKVHPSWIKKAKKLKENMSEDQKRKLLVGLRRFKEEYTGNVGGETDIANADNLVAEDEFTSAIKPERNVVAKIESNSMRWDRSSIFKSFNNLVTPVLTMSLEKSQPIRKRMKTKSTLVTNTPT